MRKLLLNVTLSALGALLVGSIAAWATNTTIGVTAGSGSLANLISFASTHVISEVGICDATTENSCGSIGTYGTAPGGVNALNVNASVTNANANGQAAMANSSPVVIASNQSSVPVTPLNTTNAGAATVKGGVGVVNGGSFYQEVAASQTATVLQSSTGAAGDYLSHCVIQPATTSPGAVTVFDNANAAATNVIAFPGGASSVSNLTPIPFPVGAVSTAGAWKVTTGANVSVSCFGKFS